MRSQHHGFPNLRGTSAALLSLLFVAVARDASVPASAAPGRKAVVLQTFHTSNFDLDLAIGECRSSRCPIEVRLLRRRRVLDRVVLPVPLSSRRAEAEPLDMDWGANWDGDPGLKGWATGVEGAYVSTFARPLTVAPQTTALVVSQRFGFEHVKRNHLVVLPRDGKLSIVWQAEEAAGPTWTATQIVGDPTGEAQDIAYFQVFSEPEENAADRFDAVRLRWDAASARFRETSLPTPAVPLYLLNLGVYENVAKAREARIANSYCLSPYWILEASSFPSLSDGKAVVGRFYTRRSSADAAARAVKACLLDVTASVVEWTAEQ